MSGPASPASGTKLWAVALKVILLLALIVAATWISHLIRDALDLRIMPSNEQAVHRTIMFGTLVYIVVLALPFVPGSEIGFAMLTAFGADIAPLIYLATIFAMMLAYSFGRLLPTSIIANLLAMLRLRRAADLITRASLLPPQDRMAMLLEAAPPRYMEFALRHRYVALAVSVNFPGNVVVGGGGGLMLLAGMSGIFAPIPTFIAIAIAVSPVPLAVMFMGY